jgi:beta-glucosidase
MSRVPGRLSALLLLGAAVSLEAQAFPYLDPDLPVEVRVADLVGRLTLEEKVSQMADAAPAIPRLGIPEYNWWNEALHGVARAGLATVFPQAIGFAATWNDSLIHRMATVISDEARAKHHEYARNDLRMRYQGLTIWSPNINLFRDPRWGRGQETYGEDPFLTGRIAVQFIRGLQGEDPDYFKTVATVKHYAVHSGPEPERHEFDAVVSERDLRESYLPHFETALREGGAHSVMCAYNRVYGEAACASDLLLEDILRGEYGFTGFVVSDCGAIDDIFLHHKLVPTGVEASAMAVRSGTDLDCGRIYNTRLVEAVHRGRITEAEINTAVTRLFTARFRLGMFDPADRVPYAQIPYAVLDQPEHRALAHQVARESMVLLKNDGLLPLPKDPGTVAVIGPNADHWLTMMGNYNGIPADPVTPLRGVREAVGPHTRVLYARGSEIADGLTAFDVIPSGVFVTEEGQPGLHARYFATLELEGEPLFTRVEPNVDANWHDGAPREDMDTDAFSVRWTGVLRPERSGQYQLGVISTMRYSLFVEDSLVLRSTYHYRDEYPDPRLRRARPTTLEAGRTYRVRVEAHESYGDASMQLVWSAPGRDLLGEAMAAADQADVVIMMLGLTPEIEGEEMPVAIPGFRGGDRTSLDLPAPQQQLLEQIVAVGKPTVLVLLNGSALAVNWAHDNVPAILEAWYPGQAGGTAIADVLFGEYNPAGRLPVTFYRTADDLPPFEDYDMRGRTYRFFEGEPLYPFGHGLSYTTFRYDDLTLATPAIAADGGTDVRVTVTNTGDRPGDEVVQLYVQHLDPVVERPRQELKGYTRISLAPGERRTVTFRLEASQLARWDPTAGGWVVDDGRVQLLVGASSKDIRSTAILTVRSR